MRFLLGETPASFLVEVMIRIAFTYVLLVVAMRLMGKRMASQTTRNELAALVSLAGGMGPSIQEPGRGLLPPLLVAAVVVAVQRLVAHLSKDHPRFERLTQGARSTLVADGVLCLDALAHVALSRERVFAQLRSAGLKNMAQVARLFLENTGAFALVTNDEPGVGLSLVPAWDRAMRDRQKVVPDAAACVSCGSVVHGAERPGRCPRGHDAVWTDAVAGA